EAGGDDEDPLLSAVGPIADAASSVAPRRLAVAAAFVHARPHPQLLAGRGIDRGHDALPASGRVEHAVRHDRRRLAAIDRKRGIAIALRGAAERRHRRPDRGLPAPRKLQILEIILADLVERRIARRAWIAVEVAPLASFCGNGRLSFRLLDR